MNGDVFHLRPLQRIRSTVDEKEQKQLLMDLDVVVRSSDCPYIVQFYGALFREVAAFTHIIHIHITTSTFLTHQPLCVCSRVTAGSAWNSWLPP